MSRKNSKSGKPSAKKVTVDYNKLQVLLKQRKNLEARILQHEQYSKQKRTGAAGKRVKRNIRRTKLNSARMNDFMDRGVTGNVGNQYPMSPTKGGEVVSSGKGRRDGDEKPDDGFIMGRTDEEMPEVAVSNLTRSLNKSQFYLYLRQVVMDAIARRFPNKLVTINGTDFGSHYLLLLFLMKQAMSACNNIIFTIQEAPVVVWNVLHLFLPTLRETKNSGNYSYSFTVPPNIMGLQGLFTDKIPAIVDGQSVSWPSGLNDSSGRPLMVQNAIIPQLTDTLVVQYGSIVWNDYIRYMAGKGVDIVPEPTEDGPHAHFRTSVALFAQAVTTGGYSACTDNTSGEFPNPLGMSVQASIETELLNWEIPWALVGMSIFDVATDPMHTYNGFNGVCFAGMALYQGIKGRQSGNFSVIPTTICVDQMINQLNFLVTASDVNRQINDSLFSPLTIVGGGLDFNQTPDSAMLELGEDDYLNGIMQVLCQVLGQYAWISGAFRTNEWHRNCFLGNTMVGGFSTLEINLPSPFVEAIRSLLVTARPDSGRKNYHDGYCPNFFMTGPMGADIVSPGGSMLEDTARLLNPKLVNVNYQFGAQTGLPLTWEGPFDPTISWVDAQVYEVALKNFSSALNLEKSYVLMQQAFSGQNDPKQTLQYYLLICRAEVGVVTTSVYHKYFLDYINNRDSLDKNFIGWDLDHFLPLLVTDPNASPENRIDLQWVQNHYHATNRLTEQQGVMMLEFDQNAMVQNVGERGGDGYSEASLIDDTSIRQGLGGGLSTFLSTARGLLPVAGNLLESVIPGPMGKILGKGAGILSSLFGKNSNLEEFRAKMYNPYSMKLATSHRRALDNILLRQNGEKGTHKNSEYSGGHPHIDL